MAVDMECVITLPSHWVNAQKLEHALLRSGNPHGSENFSVIVRLPNGCKLMIDATVRLLCLINQLEVTTKRVRLEFGSDGDLIGYLDRMGFFDNLAASVEVLPGRPAYSAAMIHHGGNRGLVEIARINKDVRDDTLPSRLAETAERSCGSRADAKELGGAVWTIFAELVANVFDHSDTSLDGYAALQTYTGGNKLSVAVSDSGLGIMRTLRPSLQAESPRLAGLSDVDLLVEVFRQGLSRHGADRGCGLKGSAAKAMKYRAELDVRLPNQRVLLTPARGAFEANTAYCQDNLPLLWGTHISFSLELLDAGKKV